jgi:hypothetical protein
MFNNYIEYFRCMANFASVIRGILRRDARIAIGNSKEVGHN